MWFLEDLAVYEPWTVVQQLVFVNDSCCCVSWCHWLYWLAQFTIAKPEVVYLLVVISHWTT